MAIQGVGPNSPIPATHNTAATADALKSPAQKIADARTEATAGIKDGDEGSASSSSVNTHA
jgi:hypothetical protein